MNNSETTGLKTVDTLKCSDNRTLAEGTEGVEKCEVKMQEFEVNAWSKWEPGCPRDGAPVSRKRFIDTTGINAKQIVSLVFVIWSKGTS